MKLRYFPATPVEARHRDAFVVAGRGASAEDAPGNPRCQA
jgi:hypothetical protein